MLCNSRWYVVEAWYFAALLLLLLFIYTHKVTGICEYTITSHLCARDTHFLSAALPDHILNNVPISY